MLLFWVVKRTLPNRSELVDITLLRAWNLGASLNIATFQDLCMLELLRKCDVIEIYNIRKLFEAAPKESPMRKFLAENVCSRFVNIDRGMETVLSPRT